MTSATLNPETDLGCPSGLAPPSSNPASATDHSSTVIDPSPFVVESKDGYRLDLKIYDAKCAGCISKIEKALNHVDGVEASRLNLSTGRLAIEWRDQHVDPVRLVETLDAIGYRTAPFDQSAMQGADDNEGRKLLRAMGVAGFAMANIMLLSISVWSGGAEMGPGMRGLLHWVSAFIAVPAALYAGQPFFRSAWQALSHRRANMDVPISLAVFLALGMSIAEFFTGGAQVYFDAAVMLLFFLLIGRYLDHRLRWQARAAARDLMAMQTHTATRVRENATEELVAARDIEAGDLIALLPGDRAPVDAVIVEGTSQVDLSIVTGETAPAKMQCGQAIHAGALNQSARLVVRAKSRVENSLIAELTRLIENGAQARSRYVRLADRAAALYVPVVHTTALLTFLGWIFLGQSDFRPAIINAIAVLIITCPCALGLAAPAVQIVATGRLFRAGVLVKSGDALERLAESDTIVFDKTGTLTLGRPMLVNQQAIPDDQFRRAASLARVSRHPLAAAIVIAAGPGKPAADAVEHPGNGVIASVEGISCRLGSAAWVGGDHAVSHTEDHDLETWFRMGDAAPVRFRFADRLRTGASDTIEKLRGERMDIHLLSGDRKGPVMAIAEQLSIDRWQAGVTPQGKIEVLNALRDAGHKVAMVGDGMNDAPSLAGAHVSLSPGSAADASQASADFVYQGDGLEAVHTARRVSTKSRHRVLQNFAFAALYNACAVPLAAFGFVTPLIAALAMSGSSLVVTLNALRPMMGRIKVNKATISLKPQTMKEATS